MANELYQYPTPLEAAVAITLDSGQTIVGQRGWYQGRDGYCLPIPASVTTTQGARLQITHDGKIPFENRGLLIPSTTGPALFALDDVTLADVPPPPAPPPPPNPNIDPQATCVAVYEQGDFDLATKEGCGLYTEACVEALHAQQSADWGHIRKTTAQNNYNGHAVDAIMLRWPAGGTVAGVYDIIWSTEAPDAKPAWSYKGEPDPNLWYYGPMPCPPA